MDIESEDRESFEFCYKKYYFQVVRVVFRIVNNHDICEEIVQDAFLKILRRPECLDRENESRQKSFIFKVARNCAIDYIRRASLEEVRLRERYLEEVVSDRNFFENIENSVVSGEVVSTLRDTIDSFANFKKKIFNDIVFENKNFSVVCAETSTSRYKIRKICREVNLALKTSLSPFYQSSDDHN